MSKSVNDIGKALISIIIPVYRVDADSFARCLDSVVNQSTSFPYECVLVFDGAPEEEVFQTAKRFVRIQDSILIESHKGVSAARNAGIAQSRGSYIMFVDADDALPKSVVEKMGSMVSAEEYDLIIGSFEKIDRKSKKTIYPIKDANILGNKEKYAIYVLSNPGECGTIWGKLYRTDTIKDNHILFDMCLDYSEDTDFILHIIKHANNIKYTKTIVYQYIRNQNSTVCSFNENYEISMTNAIQTICNKVKYDGKNEEIQSAINSFVVFHLLLIEVHYVFNKLAKWDFWERRKTFRSILNNRMYINALRGVQLRNFTLAKAVTILATKYRMFFICWIISNIRQRQIGL